LTKPAEFCQKWLKSHWQFCQKVVTFVNKNIRENAQKENRPNWRLRFNRNFKTCHFLIVHFSEYSYWQKWQLFFLRNNGKGQGSFGKKYHNQEVKSMRTISISKWAGDDQASFLNWEFLRDDRVASLGVNSPLLLCTGSLRRLSPKAQFQFLVRGLIPLPAFFA